MKSETKQDGRRVRQSGPGVYSRISCARVTKQKTGRSQYVWGTDSAIHLTT